jgi:hypothetical protein
MMKVLIQKLRSLRHLRGAPKTARSGEAGCQTSSTSNTQVNSERS